MWDWMEASPLMHESFSYSLMLLQSTSLLKQLLCIAYFYIISSLHGTGTLLKEELLATGKSGTNNRSLNKQQW